MVRRLGWGWFPRKLRRLPATKDGLRLRGRREFDVFFAPGFRESVDPKYVRETSDEALCASLLAPDFDSEALAQRLVHYSSDVLDPRAAFISVVSLLLAGRVLRVLKGTEGIKPLLKGTEGIKPVTAYAPMARPFVRPLRQSAPQ